MEIIRFFLEKVLKDSFNLYTWAISLNRSVTNSHVHFKFKITSPQRLPRSDPEPSWSSARTTTVTCPTVQSTVAGGHRNAYYSTRDVIFSHSIRFSLANYCTFLSPLRSPIPNIFFNKSIQRGRRTIQSLSIVRCARITPLTHTHFLLLLCVHLKNKNKAV